MSVRTYEIAVYEYPEGSGRAEEATQSIRSLSEAIVGSLGVKLDLRPVLGANVYPQYSGLVRSLLLTLNPECPLDLKLIQLLPLIVRDHTLANTQFLAEYLDMSSPDLSCLEDWFQSIVGSSSDFGEPPFAQFFSLREVDLLPGQGGPWGASVGNYPQGTGYGFVGYREVVYHELLHLFGVSEGYDDASKQLIRNCNPSCWMQYEPIKGSTLCEFHRAELNSFVTQPGLS